MIIYLFSPSYIDFIKTFRICPGRYLALQSTFLTISMVLATFRISTARDEDECEIIPKGEYSVGSIM